MAKLPNTDWRKVTDAMFPGLTEAERENLRKIWETNYNRFEVLKEKIQPEMDPDFNFDPRA